MQNEAIFSDLLSVIQTKRDLIILLDEIAMLKLSVYKTDSSKFESVLREKVRKKTADILTNYMEKGNLTTAAARETFLNSLEVGLKKIPFVELTVALEPTGTTSEKIVSWVRGSAPGSIVDLKIDRNIIAGAIISSNGKYFDGSISKKLEEYLNGQI